MARLSGYLLSWAVALSLAACTMTTAAPAPANDPVSLPPLPLTLDTEGDVALASAVAGQLLRQADLPAASAGVTVRLHRHADGPAYDVVVEEGGGMRDAVLRLDCPPAAGTDCAAPKLVATVVRLLGQ